MKKLPLSPVQITPHFDLETFMILSGQRRISGDQAQEIEQLWQKLFTHLRAYRLGQNKGYILIYLTPEAENTLHQEQSSGTEHGHNAPLVAQAMLMAALLEAVPEASLGTCAPVPEPNKILKNSLAEVGLEFSNSGQLSVQYGMLTRLPFRSNCEECYLKPSCPKKIMEGN
ncbi:hypothetical protein [Desulfovermiculus halophilus]|jgi:hypothetical protein|uniref:hypothetical protein n=1 Tax=Desulfovermiculus halophilus TaxID=339722 RepID=UPI000485DC56|nr:hypothetical protein [Desulfovermiculus halophilus]